MNNPKITYHDNDNDNGNGNVSSESYYINGKLHREDGPALIFYYYEKGNILSEYYYLNGKRHREDGAAYIYYYQDGNIYYEAYYLNGIHYTNSDSETFQQDLEKYHSMVRLKSFW